MKKATILIVLISMFYASSAQTIVSDSVQTDGNDVYYSLENGIVKTVSRNWHIAFSVMPTNFPTNTLQGTTIRVNGGGNYILKRVPGVKIADFAGFTDTTGLASWAENMNSDSAWDVGAFNKGWVINQTTANYGWGKYNPISKAVETDSSVWVVYREDGSWIKKMYIEKQEYDTLYTFTYANMDNTATYNEEVNKKDYPNRNFVYLNMDVNTIADREPANTDWDLVFTKYRTGVPFGPGPLVPYAVTGVLHNVGVKTEQVDDVEVWTATHTAANLDTRISTIGWDWKSYNPQAMKYDIKDSSTYFIKVNSGATYEVVFTGFSGGAAEESFFSVKRTNISTGKIENTIETFTVYPNPSSDVVNINVAATSDIEGVVRIMDVTGKIVYQENMNVAQGQQATKKIDISVLNSGMYFVTITSNNGTSSQKLIVK